MTSWEFQGRELIHCNCSWACPCQFNALPSDGYCQAVGGFAIDSGHYGDVSLAGTKAAVVLKWPGPIHEGKGACQAIVDSGASPEQREALLKILTGQDTDPFATVFAVFATTFEKVFDPIFAPIELEVDVDGRRGRLKVAGVIETRAQPIRNPVTGEEHRVRIDLPRGFEYEIAEIGSASGGARGNLEFDMRDTYAQLARLHLSNHGVVRHRPAA